MIIDSCPSKSFAFQDAIMHYITLMNGETAHVDTNDCHIVKYPISRLKTDSRHESERSRRRTVSTRQEHTLGRSRGSTGAYSTECPTTRCRELHGPSDRRADSTRIPNDHGITLGAACRSIRKPQLSRGFILARVSHGILCRRQSGCLELRPQRHAGSDTQAGIKVRPGPAGLLESRHRHWMILLQQCTDPEEKL